jgi:sucrose-6-phosphate hydrolase SacC (GH32 family)
MTARLRSPRILAAVLFSSLLAAGPAAGQIPAGQMSSPNGYAKDFAIVKRAGVFHVFYIDTEPGVGDFNYLGHQTSRDLYHWTVEPNVLIAGRAATGTPISYGLRRSSARRNLLMFYTGVRRRSLESCPGDDIQQIGVATSTDLME